MSIHHSLIQSPKSKKMGTTVDCGDFLIIRPKTSYRMHSSVIVLKGEVPVIIDTGTTIEPGLRAIRESLAANDIAPKVSGSSVSPSPKKAHTFVSLGSTKNPVLLFVGRYFYKKGYEERQEKGEAQKQLSKEFVRQWLIENGFQPVSGLSTRDKRNGIAGE